MFNVIADDDEVRNDFVLSCTSQATSLIRALTLQFLRTKAGNAGAEWPPKHEILLTVLAQARIFWLQNWISRFQIHH